MGDLDSEDPKWLSYHLYVGRYFGLMDELIVDGVAPIAGEIHPHQWFYIRYTDQNGPHLRFRLLVEAARADSVDLHVMRASTRALDKLAEYPSSGRTSLVTVEQFEAQLDTMMEWSTPVEVHRVAYEPEVDVYGLPGAGLPIAEEAFWRSSELAVEILAHDRDDATGLRKTLATCLADRLVKTFKPDQGRQKFLKMYSNYWLAATGLEHVFHEQVAIKLEDIRRQGIVVLPHRDELSPLGQASLDRWERLLRHADRRYSVETVDYQRVQKQKLTFNLLHLMNNRLGFGPLDEAYICALLMSAEPALESA